MGLHFLPKVYLRGFADQDLIWVFDRNGDRPFRTNIKSTANETKLYPPDLESYLTESVETPANRVLGKIRSKQPMTPEDREALARYLITMWKRVPAAKSRMKERLPSATEDVKREFSKELMRAAGEDPDLQQVASEKISWLSDALREETLDAEKFWAKTMNVHRVAEVLATMKWQILTSNTEQFLTCDDPVFFHQSMGIGKEQSELTFPLAHNRALLASWNPKATNGYFRVVPGVVKEINRRTVSVAKRFVYALRNESWIDTLMRKKFHQLHLLHVHWNGQVGG